MMSGNKSYTKCGAMRAASLDVLCDFVIKSFKNCGISNAMDGTEDGLLWDTDRAETDSPDTEWDLYDDAVNSEIQDIPDELIALEDE
jgi:hypothetical protein